MPTTSESWEQLRTWKERGKTTAIIAGRFQPLHNGHIALIKTIEKSGLVLHIFLDPTTNTNDGRNPYSGAQRIKMFRRAFPEIPSDHIHVRASAIHKGGEIGQGLREFTEEVGWVIDPAKCVLFYTRKKEDETTNVVDGKSFAHSHWVDILTYPQGPFDVQEISPEMTGIPLQHATDFREKRATALLPPEVAQYVFYEEDLAHANRRIVSGNKKNDIPLSHLYATESPDPKISLGKHQLNMLANGKRIFIRAQ